MLVTGGGGYVKNVPVKSAGKYGVLKNFSVRLTRRISGCLSKLPHCHI